MVERRKATCTAKCEEGFVHYYAQAGAQWEGQSVRDRPLEASFSKS